jgi:hypothetical protein
MPISPSVALLDTADAEPMPAPGRVVAWEAPHAVTDGSERPGQHHATVARQVNGEVGIAWDEFGEVKSSWFGLFDAEGQPLIDPVWLRECDGPGPCRFDVEAHDDGYWLSGSDSVGIWLMALDLGGAVVVEPYLLESAEPGVSLEAPDIALRRDGGLLVVWVRRDLSSLLGGEYATVWVDASGVPEGEPETLGVSLGGLSVPDAVGNAYGGASVAWFERAKNATEGKLHLTEWFWPGVYGGDAIVAQGASMTEPRVMLDATEDGKLVAAWRATLGEDVSSVRVRSRSADFVWGSIVELQAGESLDKPMVAASGDTAFVAWDDVGGEEQPDRPLIWWQMIDLTTMTPIDVPLPLADGEDSQTRSAMDVLLEDGMPAVSVVWSAKRFPGVAREVKHMTGRLQRLGEPSSDVGDR